MSRRDFYVYAVELAPAAARRAEDVEAVRKGAQIFYVGQTAHAVAQRLADHLAGGWASNHAVLRHALRVVGHRGPFRTRDAAEREERAEARRIRGLGHVVVGGH